MSLFRSSVLSLTVALLFMVGCGGGDGSSSSGTDSSPQADRQAPPPSGQQTPQGQSPPPGLQGPSGSAPSLDVSDQQIAAAGRVFVELQELQQEMRGSQQGQQPTKQEQQKMMQAMTETMKKAVQAEENLSVPMFQKIMMGAQQDPKLRKRLFNAIDEAGGSSPSPGPGSGQ